MPWRAATGAAPPAGAAPSPRRGVRSLLCRDGSPYRIVLGLGAPPRVGIPNPRAAAHDRKRSRGGGVDNIDPSRRLDVSRSRQVTSLEDPRKVCRCQWSRATESILPRPTRKGRRRREIGGFQYVKTAATRRAVPRVASEHEPIHRLSRLKTAASFSSPGNLQSPSIAAFDTTRDRQEKI